MKEIPLTRGKVAIVDDEDFDKLNKYHWYAQPSGYKFYAVTGIYAGPNKQKTVRMHRVLMNTPKGMHTDHIDGDGLNNQKSNLRVCTNSQNQFNKDKSKRSSSGYKGVSWWKYGNCWDVRISVNGKSIHIGNFKDKEEARKAYLEAAKKYHGQYAYES